MTSHVAGLPPPSRAAFLLDFDGTLVDIAPSPDLVVVPPELAANLVRLRDLCGGAVAIVTGRPIAQVDAHFGTARYAIAGEHGIAVRLEPDAAPVFHTLPDVPSHWIEAAGASLARYPGAFLEPKSHGFALHYRAAPEAGRALQTVLESLLAECPGTFQLMGAKMAWEVRAAGIDKGTAVRDLMAEPPFAGRLPIFVGDDVTDEDGMREARARGGLGLRVPDVFADAAEVRRWIGKLVGALPESDAWPV